MKEIVKSRATSSRIRFMLQDVLDLRDDNWRPRRLDSAPRTMDAIAKEAEQEHMAINMAPPMRKDDRNDRGGNDRDRKRGGRGGVSDDGWMVSGGRMQSNINRAPLDSNKLKVKQQEGGDVSLGSRNLFSGWGKGSSTSNAKAKPDAPPVPQTNNPYMLLSESEKPM
jgi:translation initiation factor 4G